MDAESDVLWMVEVEGKRIFSSSFMSTVCGVSTRQSCENRVSDSMP